MLKSIYFLDVLTLHILYFYSHFFIFLLVFEYILRIYKGIVSNFETLTELVNFNFVDH